MLPPRPANASIACCRRYRHVSKAPLPATTAATATTATTEPQLHRVLLPLLPEGWPGGWGEGWGGRARFLEKPPPPPPQPVTITCETLHVSDVRTVDAEIRDLADICRHQCKWMAKRQCNRCNENKRAQGPQYYVFCMKLLRSTCTLPIDRPVMRNTRSDSKQTCSTDLIHFSIDSRR